MFSPSHNWRAQRMSDVPLTGEPIPQNRPFSIEVAERVRRLPPYLFAQINRLMYEKRRSGDDVIDLGMGNPTDPPQDLVDRKAGRGRPRPEEPRLQRSPGHSQPAAGSGRQVLQALRRPPRSRSGR